MADEQTVDTLLQELNGLMHFATEANLKAQAAGDDSAQKQAWLNVRRLSTMINEAEAEAFAADQSALDALNTLLDKTTSSIDDLLAQDTKLVQAIKSIADTITKIKAALNV